MAWRSFEVNECQKVLKADANLKTRESDWSFGMPFDETHPGAMIVDNEVFNVSYTAQLYTRHPSRGGRHHRQSRDQQLGGDGDVDRICDLGDAM